MNTLESASKIFKISVINFKQSFLPCWRSIEKQSLDARRKMTKFVVNLALSEVDQKLEVMATAALMTSLNASVNLSVGQRIKIKQLKSKKSY